MSEIKKVSAVWQTSLDTTCPHCEKYIDLFPVFQQKGEFPEFGSQEGLEQEIRCPECNGELVLTETIW